MRRAHSLVVSTAIAVLFIALSPVSSAVPSEDPAPQSRSDQVFYPHSVLPGDAALSENDKSCCVDNQNDTGHGGSGGSDSGSGSGGKA